MSLYPMYPADILNIRFRPSEQQVRKCLEWIFKEHAIPYGEECWLNKDKDDFIEGEEEGNIADIIFTDKEIHDLTALELKGKYLPKKKALEQLKTYRKFVDRTYLICSNIEFDKEFLEQCNTLGVGVVSLTINMKMIAESKHDTVSKFTRSHLFKLRKYYFFELLRKFGIAVKTSDLYYESFDKYAPILLDKNKVSRGELIDEWKKQWMAQIQTSGTSLINFIVGSDTEQKELIYHGNKLRAWFQGDGRYILASPGKTWKFESYPDFIKYIDTLQEDLAEIKKRLKPMEISIKEHDER